jgi:hypothetical protein
VVQNAKVSNYLGKSLNSGNEHSLIWVNPCHLSRFQDLKKHFDSVGGLGYFREKVDAFEMKMFGGQTTGKDNFRLIAEIYDFID